MIRVIGIDPGTHTGLAHVYDGEFVELLETTFWGAYDYVTGRMAATIDLVVIEASPRKQTKVWHDHNGNPKKAGKIGQDVGSARNAGELLAEGLARFNYNVKTVPPAGKVDATVFNAVTGHQGQSNPHKRDAGMLAWTEYCRLKQLQKVGV